MLWLHILLFPIGIAILTARSTFSDLKLHRVQLACGKRPVPPPAADAGTWSQRVADAVARVLDGRLPLSSFSDSLATVTQDELGELQRQSEVAASQTSTDSRAKQQLRELVAFASTESKLLSLLAATVEIETNKQMTVAKPRRVSKSLGDTPLVQMRIWCKHA